MPWYFSAVDQISNLVLFSSSAKSKLYPIPFVASPTGGSGVTVFSVYCAVTIKSLCTFVKPLSQPVNVYPSLVGACGAVALAPLFTSWTLSSLPS